MQGSSATRRLAVRLLDVPTRADADAMPCDPTAAGGMPILLPLVPILVRIQRQPAEGILAGAVRE